MNIFATIGLTVISILIGMYSFYFIILCCSKSFQQKHGLRIAITIGLVATVVLVTGGTMVYNLV